MSKFKITRINRDESNLNFLLYFPPDKTFSDIEDVIFLVKKNSNDALANARINKKQSTGDIEIQSPDIVKVKFNTADYDNLEIDTLYVAALFCKWSGNNDFDENVERLFDFQVKQNFHNNN